MSNILSIEAQERYKSAEIVARLLHRGKTTKCPICHYPISKGNFIHFDIRAAVPLGVECPFVFYLRGWNS